MVMSEIRCTVVSVCACMFLSHIEKQVELQSLMVIVIFKFKMFNLFSLNF
jgi:accessory gene regulator protein AgrB